MIKIGHPGSTVLLSTLCVKRMTPGRKPLELIVPTTMKSIICLDDNASLSWIKSTNSTLLH